MRGPAFELVCVLARRLAVALAVGLARVLVLVLELVPELVLVHGLEPVLVFGRAFVPDDLAPEPEPVAVLALALAPGPGPELEPELELVSVALCAGGSARHSELLLAEDTHFGCTAPGARVASFGYASRHPCSALLVACLS